MKNNNWRDEIKREQIFTKRPNSGEDQKSLVEQQKQYIANAIEQGKFTAEDGLLYFLLEMDVFNAYELFADYSNCINPKKVYTALNEKRFDALDAVQFARFFGDQLSKETVDPNEVFDDCIYGENGETLGAFCQREPLFFIFAGCKDFNANVAAATLYEELLNQEETGYFWRGILEDLLDIVSDFTFLAPALRTAVKSGDESVLKYYGTLVKKGCIPDEEARKIVEDMKKENPQMFADLMSDGYADFDF